VRAMAIELVAEVAPVESALPKRLLSLSRNRNSRWIAARTNIGYNLAMVVVDAVRRVDESRASAFLDGHIVTEKAGFRVYAGISDAWSSTSSFRII
jgi:hypothetical protein